MKQQLTIKEYYANIYIIYYKLTDNNTLLNNSSFQTCFPILSTLVLSYVILLSQNTKVSRNNIVFIHNIYIRINTYLYFFIYYLNICPIYKYFSCFVYIFPFNILFSLFFPCEKKLHYLIDGVQSIKRPQTRRHISAPTSLSRKS